MESKLCQASIEVIKVVDGSVAIAPADLADVLYSRILPAETLNRALQSELQPDVYAEAQSETAAVEARIIGDDYILVNGSIIYLTSYGVCLFNGLILAMHRRPNKYVSADELSGLADGRITQNVEEYMQSMRNRLNRTSGAEAIQEHWPEQGGLSFVFSNLVTLIDARSDTKQVEVRADLPEQVVRRLEYLRPTDPKPFDHGIDFVQAKSRRSRLKKDTVVKPNNDLIAQPIIEPETAIIPTKVPQPPVRRPPKPVIKPPLEANRPRHGGVRGRTGMEGTPDSGDRPYIPPIKNGFVGLTKGGMPLEPTFYHPVQTAEIFWMREAACNTEDPELFFSKTKKWPEPQLEQAKSVCSGCRVRKECLEYALTENVPYGVYGGMSEKERQKMKMTSNVQAQYDIRNART